MSQPAHKHDESPEVIVVRKAIRGEPLTEAEQALLARSSRKPDGPTVPHEAVMQELAERERRGE